MIPSPAGAYACLCPMPFIRQLSEATGPATHTITVCAWCPGLNILKLERRYTDVVIIVVANDLLWPREKKPLNITAFLNGEKMVVSHGICERCRAKKFPETVKP